MDANQSEIQRAYKKAALKMHPDKNRGNEEEAKEKFQEISAAKEILGNPDKRRMFDDEFTEFGESTLWITKKHEQESQPVPGHYNNTRRRPSQPRKRTNDPTPPPEAFYTKMDGKLGQTLSFAHYVFRNPATDMFITNILKYKRPLYEAGYFTKVLRMFAQTAISIYLINIPYYLYIPLYITLLKAISLNQTKERGYISVDSIDYILFCIMTVFLFSYLDENGETTFVDPEQCGYTEELTDEEIKNIIPVEGFRQKVICNAYYLIEILANILVVFVKIIDVLEPLLNGGSLDAMNNNTLIKNYSFEEFKSFGKEDWLSYFNKVRTDDTIYGQKNEEFIEKINNSYEKINNQMKDDCEKILDELRKTAQLYLTEKGRKRKYISRKVHRYNK